MHEAHIESIASVVSESSFSLTVWVVWPADESNLIARSQFTEEYVATLFDFVHKLRSGLMLAPPW